MTCLLFFFLCTLRVENEIDIFLCIHGVAEVVGVEGHGYVNDGGGRGVVVLASGGLPKERKLQGKMTDNNNLSVLNNFNGTNLLEIK